MDDILTALVSLLNPLVGSTPDRFKTIVIGNDLTIRPKLKGKSLPLITLSPLGETTDLGPMANTSSRIFRVRVRIWQKSHDPKQALQPDSERNMYDTTETVRELLNGNKGVQIAGSPALRFQYHRMIPDNTTDLAAPESRDTGEMIARDIIVQYWRMEEWTGERNNQATLVA